MLTAGLFKDSPRAAPGLLLWFSVVLYSLCWLFITDLIWNLDVYARSLPSLHCFDVVWLFLL